MQEFIFTSKRFKGSMRFGYNNGVMYIFENNADLNAGQIDYFEHNFPIRIENLPLIKGETGTLQETTDLSFDNFWEKYAYKVDRISAEKYWEKMSDEEKLNAICGISKYKYRCKLKNTAMIYPIRYLRNKRWEDEQ
jgi:hypothetical protein